jgi:hypothetical protein
MKSSALVTRSWNGHAIQRRRADGYVNATAMCQVVAKRWRDYAITLRAMEYQRALEGSAGIPAHLLVQSVVTGPNPSRGTWVHPRLAVDLARWISPEFAVWMDGWILEELEAKAKPTQLALPWPSEDATQLLDLICSDLGKTADRLAAMAGFPTKDSLITAGDCLSQLKQRVAMAERLLATIKPLQRTRPLV